MQIRQIITPTLLCAFALITSGLGPAVHAQGNATQMPSAHSGHHADVNQSSTQGDGSKELDQAMKNGMEAMQKMQMTGDVDKDFTAMMKAHHEQAVAMAEVELKYGKSPQIKAMAAKMIKAQKKEIEEMAQWLKKHP